MTEKQYDYDPNLPYVAKSTINGRLLARFADEMDAFSYAGSYEARVIDTTPAPRVPEDANYIHWWDENGHPWFAHRVTSGSPSWRVAEDEYDLENLPGITPETILTILEEREGH